MKQLLILSGKGGTGKTTISSAFIKLAKAQASADCDVDAPNLHLVMAKSDSKPQSSDYYGMPHAEIDQEKCSGCGLCAQNCRFEAVMFDGQYSIDPFACEGCGLCAELCPAKAVTMKPAISGELQLYKSEKRVFSTAQLKMGRGNSGKLVTEVKSAMRKSAPANTDLAIIDGSPGLGCPVIASLSGVDLVLIVAEPSLSGLSDMERIIKTAGMFQVDMAVCVNKSDVNSGLTQAIKTFCEQKKIPFAGEVPFDPEAVKAVNNGSTVVDVECRAGAAVEQIFEKIKQLLTSGGYHNLLRMYQEKTL